MIQPNLLERRFHRINIIKSISSNIERNKTRKYQKRFCPNRLSCWWNKRKCQYANFFYESFYKQRLLILLSGELSVTINEGIVNLIEVYLWREIYTTWYNYLCIANVAYRFDMIIVSFNKKKVDYNLNILGGINRNIKSTLYCR